MRLRFITALFLWLALVPPVSAAATPPADLYQVEIVVFQTNLPYLEGDELWTNDVVNTKLPGLDKAVELPDMPSPASPLWKVAGTLEAGGDYRVLAHKRWVVPADPQASAKWIYLSSIGVGGLELQGTLRFYQSRFLHVDVELLLREPAMRASATSQPDDNGPRIYRIGEHRRIKSGQINYFDHPRFGALLEVEPVDKAVKK
jgi:hypothetical protein